LLNITENQAKYFGLKSSSQLSPMIEKCALLISANESYARGEKDLEKFTGIRVSHSTLQRLVKIQDFELPTSNQGVQEITLDGGKSGYVTIIRASRGEHPTFVKTPTDYKRSSSLGNLKCRLMLGWHLNTSN
jgi:hypothetical protein